MPFPLIAVLISAAISAGLTLLGGLLTPRPKPARPDEIQVPTATEDRIKPYFVGTVRHTSPNCIWYGDFATKNIRQGGLAILAGNPTIGYKYFIGIQLDLGWGPVDALRRVEIGGKEAWTGTVTSGNFTIDKPKLISEGPVANGFQATGTFYPGDGTQSADSYVDGKVTGSIPAYKNDAIVVFKGLSSGGAYIGNAASFPEINFDLSRYPNTLGVTGSKHIIDTYDANPVCALYEFLTRADHEFGGGFIASQFDLTNWRDVAETVYSEGLGISRIITNDQDVSSVVEDYLKLIDGVINVNMQTGLIEIKLARYDYDPDTIPHFTDDDFAEASFTRGSWSETTNEVKLSYTDRTQEHTERISAAQDSASAAANLEVSPQAIDIPGISNPTVANKIAWREVKSVSIPLGRLTGKMNREGYALTGGSVFKWSSDRYGVDAMIFRVAEASDGGPGEDAIELKCVQDVFALGDTAFDGNDDTVWDDTDLTVTAIATEAIFQQPIGFHGTSGKRVCTVAKRPSSTHVRYNLWTKLSTESVYSEKATGVDFTPTGTVQTSFISGTDTTLTVTPDTDMDSLPAAVSPTEITNGAGLIRIDSEIIAYESYTIVGGNYVFAGLHSGLYGTTPATHGVGNRAWFVSEGAGFDTTDYAAGVTVNAKLLPTTATEVLAIGSASAISVTLDSDDVTGVVGGIPVIGDPGDGDVLIYDSGSSTYVPGTVSASFDIHALTAKTTPVDADEVAIADSAASYVGKKVTWANIKATLKTYFDTFYQAVLVSGTNIKTVNSTSLLGSGDIAITGYTQEQIEDFVGAMVSGNTETGITVTYDDTGGKLNFSVAGSSFSESTVSITTASLANNAIETGTITIGRQFVVKKVVADRYCEIRLYGDSAARTADASRVFGDLSFIGTQSKYILGLLLTAATGLTWFMSPPAVGENCDSPTSSTIYYSIKNTSGSTSTVTVDFKVLILEA